MYCTMSSKISLQQWGHVPWAMVPSWCKHEKKSSDHGTISAPIPIQKCVTGAEHSHYGTLILTANVLHSGGRVLIICPGSSYKQISLNAKESFKPFVTSVLGYPILLLEGYFPTVPTSAWKFLVIPMALIRLVRVCLNRAWAKVCWIVNLQEQNWTPLFLAASRTLYVRGLQPCFWKVTVLQSLSPAPIKHTWTSLTWKKLFYSSFFPI